LAGLRILWKRRLLSLADHCSFTARSKLFRKGQRLLNHLILPFELFLLNRFAIWQFDPVKSNPLLTPVVPC
jgi:hypothetical protein